MLAVAATATADSGLGQLTCDRIEGTTVNLIITSSADVRCIFKGQGESEQWYQGETGITLGVDLKWTKSETINFAVLSSTREFTPEGDFLTGSYAGAKANATNASGRESGDIEVRETNSGGPLVERLEAGLGNTVAPGR